MLSMRLIALAAVLLAAPDTEVPLYPGESYKATPVRGVHFTAWAAGEPKTRRRLIQNLRASNLNAVVIAVKEYDGRVFIRAPASRAAGAFTPAIPDLAGVIREFKAAGIYPIARVVVFKDDILARRRPDLAVTRPDGSLWTNDKDIAWVDPYRREVWEYNIAVASAAAAAGFDEVQFDYIRFPSDGDTRQCRYSVADHGPRSAGEALRGFLARARAALPPETRLSIAVFGMTTSAHSDMGIGQRLVKMAAQVDAISPMMYPSHYAKGELGVAHPNREPYRIISRGLKDAIARLGPDAGRLRPYFQDFSLGVRYDAEKVRAQILAAHKQGVTSWILWNPQNRYTWSALRFE